MARQKKEGTMQLGKQWYILTAVAVIFFYSAPMAHAAGIKEGKWKDAWQVTKKQFEKMTGKKKPAEKVMKYFRKSSGVESALKNMDKGYKKVEKKFSKKNVKAFSETIDAYKAARLTYVKMLKGAIEAEEKKDSPYVKWLKVLKSQLKAIERNAKARLQWYLDIYKEDYSKSTFAEIKAKIKEAKVYIKKIQATPTAENWNKNPNNWLRRFFIIARPDTFRSNPNVDTGPLKTLSSRLSKFLDDNEVKKKYGQLPSNTGKKDILKRIGVLKGIMDDYQNWYKANKDK